MNQTGPANDNAAQNDNQKATSTPTSTATRKKVDTTIGPKETAFVFAVAMRYLRDEEAAAEASQDALLLAHKNRDRFRGDSGFTTWLYRIAATSSLMYLRKKRRRSREVLGSMLPANDDYVWEPKSTAKDPREILESTDLLARIDVALQKIGEKYRDIFWLRFLEGYSEKEVSKILNVRLSTVKSRSFRARALLREALASGNQKVA